MIYSQKICEVYRGTKMLMGAFNWKSVYCQSLCNLGGKKRITVQEQIHLLLKQIFKEHVKKLRPPERLFPIDTKYVISIGGKPLLFVGFRLWVFFQK